MPNDHYVARTYLKHFAGHDGLLHAYRKSDGKYFPCRPADICHEWDGDIINDFLSKPTLLGDYRKFFEPAWNPALEQLRNGRASPNERLMIAGYWANLLICTPAWRRIGVQMSDAATLHQLRATTALKSMHGEPDAQLEDALAELDAGRFTLNTEPDFVRAMHASKLTDYTWYLYNSDWTVIINDTGDMFLTSDNPVAFEDQGPWSQKIRGLPRYLAVTPELCIFCDMGSTRQTLKKPASSETDFQQPPRGNIRIARCRPAGFRSINRAIVQCAEDLVLSPAKSIAIERLVGKYAKYGVDCDFIDHEKDGAHYFVTHIRVRERRAGPHFIEAPPALARILR